MTLIAQCSAALFRVKANKALERAEDPREGLDHSPEPAMQRARNKTEQMQARAGALDELVASGALQDAMLPVGRDDIQAELEHESAVHDVELEPARMEAEQPAGGARAAMEAADPPKAGRTRRRHRDHPGLGEGQFEISEQHLDRLDELDSAVQPGVEAGDKAAITTARTLGTPLPDERITPSGPALPDEDTGLDQIPRLLPDKCLVPG